MNIVTKTGDLAAWRSSLPRDRSLGLVPTMGFLHAGHASLLRRARAENDVLALSIFVNPTQFGPNEDLARYPRDLERDLALARAEGVDLVFTPTPAEMYPAGFSTSITVSGVSEALEGAARPGHFAGVATVVAKLFHLSQPARAYFGEKDWQQLAVVSKMVRDLNFSLEVVGCPTVREENGLALSSRNSYLSPALRARAGLLFRALEAVRSGFAHGERDAARLLEAGQRLFEGDVDFHLEYLSVVDENLTVLTGTLQDAARARVLIAARVAGVRLLDNGPVA